MIALQQKEPPSFEESEQFQWQQMGVHRCNHESVQQKAYIDENRYELIGKGKNADCGDLLPMMCCQSCMKVVFVQKQCGMKQCPNCYQKWINDHAFKIAMTIADAKTKNRIRKYPVKHIVFSPSKKLYDLDIMQLRKRFNKWFKKMGLGRSGAVVFHAHRPNAKFWDEYPGRNKDVEDKKKWEWIRDQDNWEDYVEYSPHFHFIGFVWMKKPISGDDWIYKTISINKENNPKKIYQSVLGIAKYLLSHTVDDRKSKYFMAYLWYGYLAFVKRKDLDLKMLNEWEEKRKKWREEKRKGIHCKKCGGKIWYAKENLKAFFKAWWGIFVNDLNISELKERIIAQINKRNGYKIDNMLWNVYELIEFRGKDPPNISDRHQKIKFLDFVESWE